MSLATAIIERYKRYGWSTPPGEWGQTQLLFRKDFHDILERGDVAALDLMLENMFQTEACLGLVSITSTDVDTFLTAVTDSVQLWMQWTDGGNADLPRLAAPSAGNPSVMNVDGTLVMMDTPRHDHYARQIVSLLPDGGTVFEIGGGYGGMALQILRTDPSVQVVICDIPETLYLAWYWLHTIGVDVAWYDEGPDADVVLLPAQELGAWDRTPDLVFAAHSLSEFTPSVTERYMEWIRKVKPRYFYHDNALVPVDFAFPEVLCSEMVPGPPYREVYRAWAPWPNTQWRYWEFMYERS